jgi:RNA polymerase sigma-70 factor (ECF subfamily)
MVKEFSDEDLMLRYRDGDAAAFDILYCRHKGSIYRYLLRSCGNEAITEELFQDVWMNLIRARERYMVKAKFTTYLYQLARNRLIDHYRRNTANPGNDCGNSQEQVDTLATQYQDQPEVQVELRQQTKSLLELIKTLPDEQREVFLLREEAGMTVNEITEITGVNAETTKSRLRYAVSKLRSGMRDML